MDFNDLKIVDIEKIFKQSKNEHRVRELLTWFDQQFKNTPSENFNIIDIILYTKFEFVQEYFLYLLFDPALVDRYNQYDLTKLYSTLIAYHKYNLADQIIVLINSISIKNPHHIGSILKRIMNTSVEADIITSLFHKITVATDNHEILQDVLRNAQAKWMSDKAAEILKEYLHELVDDTLFVVACVNHEIAVQGFELLNRNHRMMVESLVTLAAFTKNNEVKRLVFLELDLIEIHSKIPLLKCLDIALPNDIAIKCLDKLLLCSDVTTDDLEEIIISYDDFSIFQKCLDYTKWYFLEFDNYQLESMIQESKDTYIINKLLDINTASDIANALQISQLINLVTNSAISYTAVHAFELLTHHEVCTGEILNNLLNQKIDYTIRTQIIEHLKTDQYFQFVQSLM
jgi:hypothetical protein